MYEILMKAVQQGLVVSFIKGFHDDEVRVVINNIDSDLKIDVLFKPTKLLNPELVLSELMYRMIKEVGS